MSRRNIRGKYSPITNSIFIEFIISVLVLLLILVGGFFVAYYICSQFVWQPDNPLYRIFKSLEILSPVIIFGGFFVGALIIMYISIKKPLRYFDDVIQAAKSLSNPTSEPIKLSTKLADIQNELNMAREQAIINARLAQDAERKKPYLQS